MQGDPLNVSRQKDIADTAPGLPPRPRINYFFLFGYIE
jgi:hypothetical protein